MLVGDSYHSEANKLCNPKEKASDSAFPDGMHEFAAVLADGREEWIE